MGSVLAFPTWTANVQAEREKEGQGLVDIIIIIFYVNFLIVVKVLVLPGAAFCSFVGSALTQLFPHT